jgi:hypothetical protein
MISTTTTNKSSCGACMHQELVVVERVRGDELRRRLRLGGVEQADERLPLVAAQRVPHEHHRLPLHPRQELRAVEPGTVAHKVSSSVCYHARTCRRGYGSCGMVDGARRRHVPRELAPGRLPAVPEVVGVRPAVELAVELRVDERAAVPGVRRRAVAEDPAAAEHVAARRAGRGVAPVARRRPGSARRGCRQRQRVQQEDGGRERDGGEDAAPPAERRHRGDKEREKAEAKAPCFLMAPFTVYIAARSTDGSSE